jgi:hypothetical protein
VDDLSASQRRPQPRRKKAWRVGRALDRFSLEIRALPRRTCPVKHRDPAVYVTRRNGVTTVVEIKAISDVAAGLLKQMTI